MKLKASFSMDHETLLAIEENVVKGKFRNRSHLVEFAVQKLLEGDSREP